MKIKTKVIISIVVLFILMSASKFYPVVGAQFAVQQLQDSYTSNVGVKFWSNFKEYQYLLYIGFVLILFRKNIVSLINK